MVKKRHLLSRWAASTSGNMPVIFAICLPAILAGTGMAIDTTRLFSADVNLQKSLDAAALAAAKEFGKTQDDAVLKQIAEAYFFSNAGRIGDQPTAFRYEGVRQENGHAVLHVSATREITTHFGRVIMDLIPGGPDLERFKLEKSSEIIVQNRSIEMALVLDNSGSMKNSPAGGGNTKIATLRTATTNLVNQMMAATNSNVQYPVSVSVVPFSGAVNIGAKYASAPWMDTKGLSPQHHDEFDWKTWGKAEEFKSGSSTYWRHKDTKEYLTRFYLYDHMRFNGGKRFQWAGCPQSRPNGYAITDAAPTELTPSTLFVPSFAPSEYNWRDSSLEDLKNRWIVDSTARKTLSDADAFAAQRDMKRYFDSSLTINIDVDGPNSACTTTAVTSLTKTKSTVLSAISKMDPVGGTNIAEGLAWGWRTLSSNLPFDEGKPAHTEDNMKIVVLMTDGENTYNAAYANGTQVDMPNAGRSQFGTYGYAQFIGKDQFGQETLRPGRMFDSTRATAKKADIRNVTDAMNENMSLVCENIKADGRNPDGSDGIVIFTIAFDLKDGSPVKERLRNCASSGVNGNGEKLYYDARSASDLTAAFSSITEEISSLRIAR